MRGSESRVEGARPGRGGGSRKEAPVDEKVTVVVTPWANWCITLCDGPDGAEITRQKQSNEKWNLRVTKS